MPTRWIFVAAFAISVVHPNLGRAQSFVNFESGHVRPLAASPDGTRLFAVNTPDNRLAIFDVTATGLSLAAEVPVGMEPVAVATRTNGLGRVEAWVVNHLSDSVSIVEVDPGDVSLSRVTRTLLVGDEPRDLVFAGAGGTRAFITAAHRGQNRPGDPELTTDGVGRADVWVFNATSLGAALGGTPLTVLQLFGDTPRALARSADGSIVYAAVFHSGNQTTALLEPFVTANGGLPPPPPFAPAGAPDVGLIVKFNPVSGLWEDELARDWSSGVEFDLPDQDVFRIDADAAVPVELDAISGVGTVLFNMAVRPTNGKVYVSNTEARNHVRFEGIVEGVRGNVAQNRVSIIDGVTTTALHLNPHIDYQTTPGDQDEIDASVAFPLDMVFSADGETLYVAAFGSEKVAVLDADALEAGTVSRTLVRVGGGPSGLVLDEARDRLYVLTRFDQRVAIVTNLSNPQLRAATDSVSLRYDPSPAAVKQGRPVLYDAQRTSGHGDAACASCHVFGDFDSLAWDLGDPTGSVVGNPNPFRTGSGAPFHPLKGPMTTQSLRGMADAGPMHWRGDRTGGTTGGDPLDEELAFEAFRPAFVGLLGRGTEIPQADMDAFTDFILTVQYPPNPIRALDNSPSAAEAAGETFFLTNPVDGGNTCLFCHGLPLGTDGRSSEEGETQEFKIPHLRNLYQKVGMFGVPPGVPVPTTGFLGDQVRGFGAAHDGSVASVKDFLSAPQFNFLSATARNEVVAFVMAFDTGLAPAVGQQVSVTPATVGNATVIARIDLLIARDDAGECEVIVKGIVDGEARGAVYAGGNQFRTDRTSDPLVGKVGLRNLAGTAGQEQVYTCAPPGAGTRMGIDRDEDGRFDRDELDAGTDPADPTSFAGAPELVRIQSTALTMKDRTDLGDPSKRRFKFKSKTKDDPSQSRIVVPAAGSAGDPTLHGATLRVYNANGSGEEIEIILPSSGWTITGAGFKYKSTDPSGPMKLVTVGADSLVIKGGYADWAYTLNEPSQGRIAVRLALGTDLEWCAEAPAKLSGSPPSTAKNDRVDRFKAAKKSPAPAGCPPPPLGSPSGAFLDGD